jgi:hypothetical protein
VVCRGFVGGSSFTLNYFFGEITRRVERERNVRKYFFCSSLSMTGTDCCSSSLIKCVCVCVCVCDIYVERERGRERERKKESCACVCARQCLCACEYMSVVIRKCSV